MPEMNPEAVQLGDTIIIPKTAAWEHDVDKIPVKWQKLGITRLDHFYTTTFELRGRNSEEPLLVQRRIFIDVRKVTKFKTLTTALADGRLEAKITEDFRYGQKNEHGDNRWLVFMENKDIYQHRFALAINAVWGDKASDILQAMGYEEVGDSSKESLSITKGSQCLKFG